MKELVVYEKPTCSTCRAAVSLLNEAGVPFARVRYYEEPFTEKTLTALIKKIGIKPRELLRSREALYKKLDLEHSDHTNAELIALMVKHPDLIQRPILEYGDRAILGRPIERIGEFLKTLS